MLIVLTEIIGILTQNYKKILPDGFESIPDFSTGCVKWTWFSTSIVVCFFSLQRTRRLKGLRCNVHWGDQRIQVNKTLDVIN